MKPKSKNHPDATNPTLNFNDEIGHIKSLKKQWWQEVPKELAQSITKETCKKLGV